MIWLRIHCLFFFSENRMPLNPLDSHQFPFENIWHHYLESTYPISETHLASFDQLVFTHYCWGCHMTLFYLLEQHQATIKYTLIISSPMFLSVKSISLSKVGDLISRDPAVPSMLPVVNWYDLNSLKEKYLYCPSIIHQCPPLRTLTVDKVSPVIHTSTAKPLILNHHPFIVHQVFP